MLKRYEAAVNELRKSLLKELKDGIKSIVLYGSMARKEAGEESDIDIFVVLKDNSFYRKVSDIAYKVDLKNGTATSLFWATQEELARYVENGSPFIENVVEEGIVLYDDGTFTRIRESIAKKGG